MNLDAILENKYFVSTKISDAMAQQIVLTGKMKWAAGVVLAEDFDVPMSGVSALRGYVMVPTIVAMAPMSP